MEEKEYFQNRHVWEDFQKITLCVYVCMHACMYISAKGLDHVNLSREGKTKSKTDDGGNFSRNKAIEPSKTEGGAEVLHW